MDESRVFYQADVRIVDGDGHVLLVLKRTGQRRGISLVKEKQGKKNE
jgi:hypothetical protein